MHGDPTSGVTAGDEDIAPTVRSGEADAMHGVPTVSLFSGDGMASRRGHGLPTRARPPASAEAVGADDQAVALDGVAVDAGGLVIGGIPEAGVPGAVRRVDVIDALGDDGTALIDAQGAELVAGLGEKRLGVARPAGIIAPRLRGAAAQIAPAGLLIEEMAVILAVAGGVGRQL